VDRFLEAAAWSSLNACHGFGVAGARSQMQDLLIGAGTISTAGPVVSGTYERSRTPGTQSLSRDGVHCGPTPRASNDLPAARRAASS
jgi:hypothetical protein